MGKKCKRVQKKAIVGFYVVYGGVCDRYMTAAVTDRASTMCSPSIYEGTAVKFSNADFSKWIDFL